MLIIFNNWKAEAEEEKRHVWLDGLSPRHILGLSWDSFDVFFQFYKYWVINIWWKATLFCVFSLETSLAENVNRENGNLRKLQQNEKGNIANLRMKVFFVFVIIATTSFRFVGFFGWLVWLAGWCWWGAFFCCFCFVLSVCLVCGFVWLGLLFSKDLCILAYICIT